MSEADKFMNKMTFDEQTEYIKEIKNILLSDNVSLENKHYAAWASTWLVNHLVLSGNVKFGKIFNNLIEKTIAKELDFWVRESSKTRNYFYKFKGNFRI